jgi:predicted MFS family arabinose efflux permease
VLTVWYFLFKDIDPNSASYLLSIIGITNTIGRVVVGYVADFPQVNALLMNNICLVVSTIAVAATPLCSSYAAYITMSIFFGIAICKYTDNIACVSKFYVFVLRTK